MAGTRISRRSMLGTVGAASLAPALLQASASASGTDPRPDPASLPHASPLFVARLQVGACATDGAISHAPITGGELHGHALQGVVQGGRIEWQRQASGLAVAVRFAVRRADGTLAEISERGLQADCCDIAGAGSISTVAEAPGPDSDSPATPALRVGRLDVTRLSQGVARLLAFEVT